MDNDHTRMSQKAHLSDPAREIKGGLASSGNYHLCPLGQGSLCFMVAHGEGNVPLSPPIRDEAAVLDSPQCLSFHRESFITSRTREISNRQTKYRLDMSTEMIGVHMLDTDFKAFHTKVL